MIAVVTGGLGTLGKLICTELKPYYEDIICWDLPAVDVATRRSVQSAAQDLHGAKVSVLVNCAGINKIAWLEATDPLDWHRVMDTNAMGIFNTVRALLPNLKGGTVCNVLSAAAYMPMTASIAYNASKAAAAMVTLQMARELGRTHNITVFGVSPGKLKGTGMSKYTDATVPKVRGWTLEEAKAHAQAASLTGHEIPPQLVAEYIGWLLANKMRHFHLQGCIMPYGVPR